MCSMYHAIGALLAPKAGVSGKEDKRRREGERGEREGRREQRRKE